MCECIKEINKKLKEAASNTKLDVPFLLPLDSGSIRVSIATCKMNRQSRKKKQRVLGTYCPFCGEKYES